MIRSLSVLCLVLLMMSFIACMTQEQKEAQYDEYFLQGYALTQEGKDAEAMPYYRKAIRVRPGGQKAAGAYNNLGWSLMKLGQPEDAIKAYKRAIVLQPDYELAKNNLAAVEAQLQQKKQPAQ